MNTDIKVNATVREGIGKGHARRLRAEGMIPAAVYGEGEQPVAVAVNAKEINQILRSEHGHNTIFSLAIGDAPPTTVIIKDWYADPVKGKLLHADLMRLSLTRATRVKVPVDLVGEPYGVKNQGGVLEFDLREVEIECLPTDIPNHVQVDIAGLHINQHATVADLLYDRTKIKMITDEHHTVAGVVAPRLAVEETPAVEEGAEGEPEVIKKGKTEE
jgi:large subunit ribosomal protein L25